MRARWLKPEFFTDKKIAALGPIAALIYQALWCMADDGGTALADADVIKAQCFFRWSAVGVPEISEALRHLSDAGRITRYVVEDDEFARIVRWSKHQLVHKPSKFRHPRSGQPVTENSAEVPGTSAALPVSRLLDSKTPRHLSARAKTPRETDADFEVAWAAYPKRGGGNPKGLARSAWDRCRASGVAATDLIVGVQRYARFIAGTGKAGSEYVKQAAAFFGVAEGWKETWALPVAVPDSREQRSAAPRAQTPDERRAAEDREKHEEERRSKIERAYTAARDVAVREWMSNAAPEQLASVNQRADRATGSMQGEFAKLTRKAVFDSECAKLAGFPDQDAWVIIERARRAARQVAS